MLENFINLFERFVVAHEKIAMSFGNPVPEPVTPEKDQPKEAASEPEASKLDEPLAETDYTKLTNAQLKSLCADKGITVLKGTRKTTLVKMLNERNKKDEPVKPPPIPEEIVKEEPVKENPVDAEPEVDPFADDAPSYTINDVRAILQKLMKITGPPAIIDILKKVANVERVNDIPEEKYNAVYEAAQKGL